MPDDNDHISELISKGLLISTAALGIYVVAKAFSRFRKGDKISDDDLISSSPSFTTYNSSYRASVAPPDAPTTELCENCGINEAEIKCQSCGRSVCRNCSWSDYYCSWSSCYD